MKNLELANKVVNKLGVSIDLSYCERGVNNKYLDDLRDRCEDALNMNNIEFDQEYVTMEEAENDFEWYIKHQIKRFIEQRVNIDERYESISIEVYFDYDLEDALEEINEEE